MTVVKATAAIAGASASAPTSRRCCTPDARHRIEGFPIVLNGQQPFTTCATLGAVKEKRRGVP